MSLPLRQSLCHFIGSWVLICYIMFFGGLTKDNSCWVKMATNDKRAKDNQKTTQKKSIKILSCFSLWWLKCFSIFYFWKPTKKTTNKILRSCSSHYLAIVQWLIHYFLWPPLSLENIGTFLIEISFTQHYQYHLHLLSLFFFNVDKWCGPPVLVVCLFYYFIIIVIVFLFLSN